MGTTFFFASGGSKSARTKAPLSAETLHRLECKVCPLNNADVLSPKMEPTGSEHPALYVLGEAPGEEEDKRGRQFVGRSGDMIRPAIPERWRTEIRWNNIVRNRPPDNRTPEYMEIEACRPSIERDIAATKPQVIVGFGAVPLAWITGQSTILQWRGRRLPVVIAGHACWYYPMVHPSYVLRSQNRYFEGKASRDPLGAGSEDARMFTLDLRRVFHDLDEGLPDPVVHSREQAMANVSWVTGERSDDLDRVRRFLEKAVSEPTNGVDYETQNRRPYLANSRILSAAVATAKESLAFAFDHDGAKWSKTQRKQLGEIWTAYLRAPKVKRVVHSLAFEMEWTAFFFGVPTVHAGLWEDTFSQASILDNRIGDRKPGCFALDFLCLQYFGLHLKGLSPLDRAKLELEPLADVLRYNAFDAKYHRLLFDPQEQRLQDEGLQEVYESHLRRIKAFSLTQYKGVLVDPVANKVFARQYETELAEIQKRIGALPDVATFNKKFNKTFNPSSGDDVRDLLVKVLGFNISVEDERGKIKEQADETMLLTLDHPVAPAIIDWRSVSKMKSTYVDSITPGHVGKRGVIVYDDGCIHHVLNSAFAETGRSSAEDPNMQNWPKRDAEQKTLRKQIVARKGHVFLSVDYGQIQFRNIAMESCDTALIRVLWERYDVHTEWTYRLAHADPDWMDPHIPQVAKKRSDSQKAEFKRRRDDVKNQWTFPLCFGAQLKSVAGYLGIAEDKLEPLFNEFWRTFSGVKDWQDRIVKFYQTNGYVTGVTKRRRYGPLTPNQLINAPIQADESEIVLSAMADLCDTRNWDLQPVLEIHDDLTFELPDGEETPELVETIIKMMVKPTFDWINVPLVVEPAMGPNWYELEGIGEYWSDEIYDHRMVV